MRKRAVVASVGLTAAFFVMASPAWAVTFTVDRSDDPSLSTTPTANDCTAAANDCSLRGAMERANAAPNSGGPDIVAFAIPGNGPHTISPAPTELPDIEDPVTIDGYTESLGETTPAIPNTLAFGTNAVLRIVISGPATHDDPFNGFDVEEGPTTIRGLVMNGFKQAQNGSGGQAIGFFNLAVNTNNVVEGNIIGTNAAGTAIAANDGDGVIINGPGSTGKTIGGTSPAARNLISGNDEQGVEISASDSNKVLGNLIGTDKTGTSDLGNLQDGVRTGSSSKNLVTDNVVAFNDDNGVEVQKSGPATPVGNRILSNSVFSNQNLGIDLNDSTDSDPDGREQDPRDPDTGPNNLQNYPVITAATSTGTTTTIAGTLNSKPRKTFAIQLFSNPAGTDEGKTFLGQVQKKTNRQGKASFSYFGPAVAKGNETTATATGVDGTSEFSDPVEVVPAS